MEGLASVPLAGWENGGEDWANGRDVEDWASGRDGEDWASGRDVEDIEQMEVEVWVEAGERQVEVEDRCSYVCVGGGGV